MTTHPALPGMHPAAEGLMRPALGPAVIQRVLLATDLSATSELATEWALGLAERNDAALLVVSVIDPGDLRLPGGRWRSRVDLVRDDREMAAQALVKRGRNLGVPVTFLVWTGDPGETIVSAAQSEAADVLVVGAHGRGVLGRLLLGSVSEYVARHAPCPVLVVRATTPAETTGAASTNQPA